MGFGCNDCCCGCADFVDFLDFSLEDLHLYRSTEDNTPRFVPNISRGKVVSVYDGDSLLVAARHDQRGRPALYRVRLAGIDAAELTGHSRTKAERAAAVAARDALRDLVQGKMVSLRGVSLEKYGRVLCSVNLHGTDISQWMLTRRYAVPYDGGTKKAVDWNQMRRV